MFQFHGCYFHGCRKCYDADIVDRDAEINGRKTLNDKLQATEEIEKYIIDSGYKLKFIWECQWREMKNKIKLDKSYLYPGEEKYRLTEKTILSMIQDGTLFGAVEVDICVPKHLEQYFSEMTPIFKNTTVTEDDIGAYMKQYMKEAGVKFTDTRYLIGSMFGEKILLITPLIKWYLEHGLIVQKVHQVVQFNPKRCFKRFADEVSDDRRAGI